MYHEPEVSLPLPAGQADSAPVEAHHDVCQMNACMYTNSACGSLLNLLGSGCPQVFLDGGSLRGLQLGEDHTQPLARGSPACISFLSCGSLRTL